ncbi:hypothetical protein FBZ89_10668 [Nitrospirillum amazonense]|uniref:Uncharacterized protein n=1 Tax=Nitrospirillum amazonense TaxID=28077 RepID=A0A560FGE7_9PROT|nr:hypothetical protein [Nitrospirillum amazonense]TWB20669.1 hypothetical protein FBZ89_10668 [Nitrospirillum amazonense]
MAREDIHAALFARLTAAAPFATASRRVRLWNDLSPAQQPALFLMSRGEEVTRRDTLPAHRVLRVDILLYAQAPDDETAGAVVLNPLLDAVEAALRPPPGQDKQTLGGLVHDCWIEGQVTTDEGALGSQAVAIVPLHLLIP